MGGQSDKGRAKVARHAAGFARFIRRAGRLKRVKRTGWLDRGVPRDETESVAGHTFGVALLAWLAAANEPGLDRDRILKLALLHDLPEAETGDLPPYDPNELAGVDDETRATLLNQRLIRSEERTARKRAAEAAVMRSLLAELPAELANELADLWRELEEGLTPEARFVKQSDKLETYLQSLDYLADDPSRPMASFAAEVAEVIDAPILAAIRDVAIETDE